VEDDASKVSAIIFIFTIPFSYFRSAKQFGQAFTFMDDSDSQGLPPRPAQKVSMGGDFFSFDSNKPTRSSSYISSDSSCSSSESAILPGDHQLFRLVDTATEGPQATPVREPSVQETITPSHGELDSHLLSVAKELVFSPTNHRSNSPTPSPARLHVLAAPAVRPQLPTTQATQSPQPPTSFTKKPPAFALSMPQILPTVSKKAPAAQLIRPKTAPAQSAAAGSAPAAELQSGTKRSAEGAPKPALAKPIAVKPPTVNPIASKTTTSKPVGAIIVPILKAAAAKAPAAAQVAAQPSILSPPAPSSSFFSAAGSLSDATSDERQPKVHFVTPSGPKTSAATEDEDHLLAAFSSFSPTPGAATGGGPEPSTLPRDSGIAMLVSPGLSHFADVSELEDADHETVEPPPYSQHFMPASSATTGPSSADASISDAQALQTCEDMGLRVEEGNERLAKLRHAEREGRAKMAQKIAEAAHLESK